MGKTKVVDGIKLSILVPAGDLKRLKYEAVDRGMLESSIVLEALHLHWGQGAPTSAVPVPLAVAPIPAQADILPPPTEPISTAVLPAKAEPMPTPAQFGPAAALVKIPAGPSRTPRRSKTVAEPAPAPETPVKSKPVQGTRNQHELGDRELFREVEATIKAGKITPSELMQRAAPGITTGNFRSSWTKCQWIPAKYVQAVRAVMNDLKVQAEEPAGDSQV